MSLSIEVVQNDFAAQKNKLKKVWIFFTKLSNNKLQIFDFGHTQWVVQKRYAMVDQFQNVIAVFSPQTIQLIQFIFISK